MASTADKKVEINVVVHLKRQAPDELASAPKRVSRTQSNEQQASARSENPAASTIAQRHRSLDSMIETMQFHHSQIEEAMELWIRQKGGEEKLGDANASFLRTIRASLYSGSLSMKLQQFNEANDDAVNKEHVQNKRRLRRIEDAIENQNTKLVEMENDLDSQVWDVAYDAVDEALTGEKFNDAVRDALACNPDIFLSDEMIEVRDHVLAQIKAEKNAPESSQDVLREHEAEIGL